MKVALRTWYLNDPNRSENEEKTAPTLNEKEREKKLIASSSSLLP